MKNTMAALRAEAPAPGAGGASGPRRARRQGPRSRPLPQGQEVRPVLSDERLALFTKWRVGAFGRKLREVCEDESCDDMTFEEEIELCVDAEIEARDGRKIERAVRSARFKIKDACVEDIYYLPDRSLTRGRVARLASCAWVEARENLVVISESGGGKSYVAQALGVSACRRLMSVRYARLNDMFREINVARTEGRVYDALDRFSGPDLLILDDFFTTPIENPLNAVDLFEMLEAREGRGSTLIASQLEPDQWYLRINSELCADSILNRVVEHARFLDIKGPNMRKYTARLRAGKDEDYWKRRPVPGRRNTGTASSEGRYRLCRTTVPTRRSTQTPASPTSRRSWTASTAAPWCGRRGRARRRSWQTPACGPPARRSAAASGPSSTSTASGTTAGRGGGRRASATAWSGACRARAEPTTTRVWRGSSGPSRTRCSTLATGRDGRWATSWPGYAVQGARDNVHSSV